MAEFQAVTACNDPRITDHDAVQEILMRYWVDPDFCVGFHFNRDTGEPYLFMYGYAWPEAWPVPEGVLLADFSPFDDGVYERGEDGFLQLLRDLAPYLAEPLTVQAIGSTRWNFPLSACEWHVEPGRTDIHVHEFQHSQLTLV